ncbi:MAG: hypothetical protein KKA79_08535 [Nanoarchaeota archaeon]|nr:hypothetical protein [Nanoarchaeota archaeon]MCG2717319.1 hypothetical protein [Nanoarchaeota archaeon]
MEAYEILVYILDYLFEGIFVFIENLNFFVSLVVFLLIFLPLTLCSFESGKDLKDVTDVSQMEGTIPMEGGGFDVSNQIGTNRILTPTDTSITPLKTGFGEITNAKLENHISNFGDLVEGKITSFTDNNLISMKSMFDPDLRIEIIMGKDGWARVEQYDKYGRLINSMIV